jgi:pimeloyl-ACP methyl ester carboxylesterase
LPRTSSAIVADLHAALSASGESPPYVLVGHSMGGLNMTLYTYLHREQIVGLVEVDPALEGLRNCADLARAGAQAGCFLADDPAAPAFQQAEDLFAQRASTWETLASEWEHLNATQPGVQPTDTREVWAARRGAASATAGDP